MGKCRGFTLLELVLFIAIIAVLTNVFFLAYRQILLRAQAPAQLEMAGEIAQARMEFILGQRAARGFSQFLDPCDSGGAVASICTASTRVAPTALPLASSANEAVITVTGRSPNGTTVTLSTLVGNY